MSDDIRPGTRLRVKDASGEVLERVATSKVEGVYDARGRIQHDFAGVYVRRPDTDGGSVFWPLEDVEVLCDEVL